MYMSWGGGGYTSLNVWDMTIFILKTKIYDWAMCKENNAV